MVRNLTAFYEFFQPQQSLCNQWHQAWDTDIVLVLFCGGTEHFSHSSKYWFYPLNSFLIGLTKTSHYTTKIQLINNISSQFAHSFTECDTIKKRKKICCRSVPSSCSSLLQHQNRTTMGFIFFSSQGRITNGVFNLKLSPHVFR